jgi:hypothetical protein
MARTSLEQREGNLDYDTLCSLPAIVVFGVMLVGEEGQGVEPARRFTQKDKTRKTQIFRKKIIWNLPRTLTHIMVKFIFTYCEPIDVAFVKDQSQYYYHG